MVAVGDYILMKMVSAIELFGLFDTGFSPPLALFGFGLTPHKFIGDQNQQGCTTNQQK